MRVAAELGHKPVSRTWKIDLERMLDESENDLATGKTVVHQRGDVIRMGEEYIGLHLKLKDGD